MIPSQMNPKEHKKKKGSNTFQTYIHKVLKSQDVHPDMQLSAKASTQLSAFISTVCKMISGYSQDACILAKKSTISSKEIVLGASIITSGNLKKQMINKINNSLELYSKPVEDTKPTRRENRAGLNVSVALCEKFIRRFGHIKVNVAKTASVALACVCEYLIAEILKLAGNGTRDEKKVIIKIRHIYLAILHDEELRYVMDACKIEFMGAGVVPHIRQAFLPTSKPSKGKPGSRVLHNIKECQKSQKLLLQKRPFSKVISHIAKTYSENVRFGGGFFLALQAFVEQKVTNLLNTAQSLALHGKRDGVNDVDLDLAWKLTEPSIPYISELGYTQDDGKPLLRKVVDDGIERLSFRGGVKRKKKLVYEAVRRFIQSLLETILYRISLFADNRKVMTFGIKDLKASLETMNIYYTTYALKSPKKIKISTKED